VDGDLRTTRGRIRSAAVTLDPKNPLIVWIGSGEKIRSAAGVRDGVYRSRTGGASWENLGLKIPSTSRRS